MKVLDSSVIVAIFLEEDINHNLALEIINKINEPSSILLHYAILTEVVTVLTYKHSKLLANKFYEYVLSDNRFIILDGEYFEELFYWKNVNKKVSFVDILGVYLSKKYNAELITFDKEQAKIDI